MLSEDKEKKLIQIFIAIDDFCLQLQAWKQTRPENSQSISGISHL